MRYRQQKLEQNGTQNTKQGNSGQNRRCDFILFIYFFLQKTKRNPSTHHPPGG